MTYQGKRCGRLTRIRLQETLLQTYDACEISQPITQNHAGTLTPGLPVPRAFEPHTINYFYLR